eukprot:s1226_g11.t4
MLASTSACGEGASLSWDPRSCLVLRTVSRKPWLGDKTMQATWPLILLVLLFGVAVALCSFLIYVTELYRLCPGWAPVRSFDKDGAPKKMTYGSAATAAAKSQEKLQVPWDTLEKTWHPVHGEVEFRPAFCDTQYLRSHSTWWARDEPHFKAAGLDQIVACSVTCQHQCPCAAAGSQGLAKGPAKDRVKFCGKGPLAELDTAVFGPTRRDNMRSFAASSVVSGELREKEKAKKPRRRGGASANVEKGIFKPYHSVSVPKHADLLHHFQADRPKTTVMLRNIPNRYSQASLLQEIDLAGYRGTYDFFYLPMDTQNRTNVGYAFINFLTSPDLERFMMEFAGYLFQNHSSQKVARVSLAHIQGFIENIRHFSNRAVSQSRNSQYRPIVIHQGVRMDISEAYDLLCSVQAGQSSQDDSAKVPLPPGSLAVAEPPGLSENLPSILPHLASGPSTSEDYAERYSEAKKGFEEAVSMLLRSSCSGREAEAFERPELEDDERTEGSHSQPGSPRRIFQGVPGAKNIPVPFFLGESPQGGAEASDLATPRTNRTLFVHGRFSA